MIRFFYSTILLLSIAGVSFAQTEEEDLLFDNQSVVKVNPPLVQEDRQLIIPLENGNKVLVGLQRNQDLLRFRNIDSVLTVFLTDLALLKDSLQSSTQSVKIAYILKQENRSMRFWRYPMKYTKIQFQTSENVLVKASQDTIIIDQEFSELQPLTPAEIQKNAKGKATQVPVLVRHHFRLYFLVNNLAALEKIAQEKLNPKIEKLISDMQKRPERNIFDKNIWASQVQYTGMDTPASIKINKQLKPDHILIIPRFGMGLVGNDFMPSIGANVIYLPHIPYSQGNVHGVTQTDGFLLGWDRFFIFDRGADKQLAIRSNDFVSLGMALFKPNRKNNGSNQNIQWAEFKISYLVRRQGDAFRPQTFRVSTAFSPYLSVKGLQRLRLEPELYFNSLFKHVYPGMRLTLGF